MSKENTISRRHFLGLAGGAVSAAALASAGGPGWSKNDKTIDGATLNRVESESDVLVIGGGMAGLFAAVKAHDAGAKVMLASKGRIGASGQTPFAKGMFSFDAKEEGMSLEQFESKVSYSSFGSNNSVYTKQMAAGSKACIQELEEWGFFDSALCNKAFMKPIKERKISVAERITITHLIKENGRIAGAAGFSIDEPKVHFFKAKSVILCTGAGGFKPNGFPICDLTHDGTIMAYEIGALVTGKEWNDGHPGQSENAAACYDGWHGMFERVPSTVGVGIRHDLGMDQNYMNYMGGGSQRRGPGQESATIAGGPIRPQGLADERQHSKGGDRPQRDSGPGGDKRPDGPPPRDGEQRPEGKGEKGKRPEGGPPGAMGSVVGGSSAGMAIHKAEGLVPVDGTCASSVPGLYAAGDALGSYMAGTIYTQIGSSLSGSAVQGAVAGKAAALYASSVSLPSISATKLKAIKEKILAPLNTEAGYSPAWLTQTLQGIMIPNFVLYIKKESMLRAALAYVEELRDHHLPMLKASDLHELRLAHETRNMIISAEMKLKASLMRTESRCSHYRLDYPEMDDENWQAWINIYKGDNGDMQFKKQAFGTWPNGTAL